MDTTQSPTSGDADKKMDKPFASVGSFSEIDIANIDRVRAAHDTRFGVVRDLINAQSTISDQLAEFCNDAHRWMLQVDHALRMSDILPPTVPPPAAPTAKSKRGGDAQTPGAQKPPATSVNYRPQRARGDVASDGMTGAPPGRPGDRASNVIMNLLRRKDARAPQPMYRGRPNEWEESADPTGRPRRGGGGGYNNQPHYPQGNMSPHQGRQPNRGGNPRRGGKGFVNNRGNKAKQQQKEGANVKSPPTMTSTPAVAADVASPPATPAEPVEAEAPAAAPVAAAS